MQPVPRRVLKSYNIRYQLQRVMGPDGPPGIEGAVDLHAHAQVGTENPYSMARAATRAGMGAVVFKNLPSDAPRAETCRQVQEDVNRWAEAEGLAPVTCYHGAQTDPDYGGLEFEQIREAVDAGARVIWFPVISAAHSLHRVGAPLRAAKGDFDGPVVYALPWDEARRAGQYLLDDDGATLRPVAREILQLAADRGVAVSFAHSSKPEMEALAEQCTRLNYRQAFIDHPYGPQVGLEFEDLAPFAQAGIWFNFTFDEISPLLGVDPQDMMDTVKSVGPEHFTFSSDGGNPLLPGAVDALQTLVRYGRAYGLSDDELRMVTVSNPRKVLGLDSPA
jgi:hypothetical protein